MAYLCTMLSISAFGQQSQVELVDRNIGTIGRDHRNDIPVVTYDDNTINISSEVELNNAQIVITGKLGEVLYQGIANLNQTQTTIVLPQSEISEKDAIELYCDDKAYYGEFEE